MHSRIVWFGCTPEETAEHPEVLRMLQESMGLNTLIPESRICHTSGFKATLDLVALSPFEGWREREEMKVYLRYHSGPPAFPVLPGVLGGFSDDALLKLLAEAHRLGMEVWGHLGLWCYGAELFPEYAMRDIEGRAPEERYYRVGAGFCPSKAKLNSWIKTCLVDVSRRYEIDGLQLDHARYPHPANFQSLLGCGCPDCVAEASKLGYDFPKMKSALLGFKQYVRQLNPGRVRAMADTQFSLMELLSVTGHLEEIAAWLTFRAELLSLRMREFAEAVRQAVERSFVIGTDVFPPSIALMGGHIYRGWEQNVDYLMGGFGGLAGWPDAVLTLFREFASLLCGNVKGLDEADALRFVYGLLGYGDLGLPHSVQALNGSKLTSSITKALRREMLKAKVLLTGRVPFYISLPNLPAEPLRDTLQLARQIGYEGVVLASIDNPQTWAAVRESLSA
ncbi:MAG: hypothetical protein QW057_01820 [Candidatus Bathyarchaeia archaeon]